MHGYIEGVLVIEVVRGSHAYQAGLRQGDVIVAAHRIRVKNLQALEAIVDEKDRALVLQIQRGSASLFVLL